MSINKRQFNLLKAMGITVWQRRELSNLSPLPTNAAKTIQNSEHYVDSTVAELSSESKQVRKQAHSHEGSIAIELKALLKQQLFKDIINSIGASSADLSIEHNQIDLGIINWQFSHDKNIEFEHNCLKTPDLSTLANSAELKKSLWQLIGPLSAT